MNYPNVVYVNLTNGDEILFVNRSQIMLSEKDFYVPGVYEAAGALAEALTVNLVEYLNIPVPDYDDWSSNDVLDSLPKLPFTCDDCGRVYNDSTVCSSDDCPSV